MTTIRDVAKRAGVAPITVSRVVNSSGYVSDETRTKVKAAISALGYVPSGPARSLRTSRTDAIALVLTDITNPFFTAVARGVEDTASEAGFTVTYCNTDEDTSKELSRIDLLLRQQVDGILLVPAMSRPHAVTHIRSHKVPVVVLDRRIPREEVDVVRCDSNDGAYELTRHLLALGHRRIGVLTGAEGISTADDRLAGYRRAMSETGVAIEESWVRRGAFTQKSGYEMAGTLLALDPRPTALFAANNFLAIGAMKALQECDCAVPGDISLVAFDDLPEQLVMFPFLTVAAQPAYQMGQEAARLLLARITAEDFSGDAVREIILPTELVVRRSSGPPGFNER